MTDEPENLMLHLFREISEGQMKMKADIDNLKADMKEVRLAAARLEVLSGRMTGRKDSLFFIG